MNKLCRRLGSTPGCCLVCLASAALLTGTLLASSASGPANKPSLDVPDAQADSEAGMKFYTEPISGTKVKFDMVPVRGGQFVMGSPASEPGRHDDESPQHEVVIDPFWMGKCEVTWDEYENWMFSLEITRRKTDRQEPTKLDLLADAVTRPTKPYTDMTFGMGKEGFPAICMTQLAAKTYCEWLSAKTGRYHRLPTEAEWEYACRAGTTTAYSFGSDPSELGQYAWYADNSLDGYHPVGRKKPNPWGLYDMHGNVAEWCLDQYVADFYSTMPTDRPVKEPLAVPAKRYPRVVRGGSWDDEPELLRSAARRGSSKEWSVQDPQIPQSIWYHTDALFAGFRVVRPLKEPPPEQKERHGPDKFQQ